MEVDNNPSEPLEKANESNLESKTIEIEDKIESLRERIKKDIYDVEAQKMLLEESINDPEKYNDAYEQFLSVFPTAGWIWNQYVQNEIKNENFEHVEEIFNRCLISSVNVDLWKTYLGFIVESLSRVYGGRTISCEEKIKESYEFALGHIGMDLSSLSIWQDYINFLKISSVDQQVIYDVYFRAICNPMNGLELMWKEFEGFEKNADLTKKPKEFKNLVTARYKTAIDIAYQRNRHSEGINKNALATPPGNQINDLHQSKLWKQLIDFEKHNSQDFEIDKVSRVTFTYNQALVPLYHYPEIWHQSALYQIEQGNIEDAKKVYQRSVSVLSNSLLLHFQYLDFLELHNMKEEADELYKQLLNKSQNNVLVWIQYMNFCRRVIGIQASRKVFFKARKIPSISYHIYVAAAQLEYYINKDPVVARNIFELGYHQFERNLSFLQHYIQFLFHRNEDSHMRVLFEKILTNLPNHQAFEIWNQFLNFENICGNLEPAYKVQTRRSKAYTGLDPSGILGAVHRYRFLDLWPCSNNELLSFSNEYEIDQSDDDDEDNNINNSDEDEDDNDIEKSNGYQISKSELIMPDTTQMTPYKGKFSSSLSIRLDELMSKLPAAGSWIGPIIDTERLLKSIMTFIELQITNNQQENQDEDEEDEYETLRQSAMANDLFRKNIIKKKN